MSDLTKSDPSIAHVVVAVCPNDHRFIKLGTHPNTIGNMLTDQLNVKLGEYCGLVHGNLVGEDGLANPVAIFQGLKRPMLDHGLDSEVCVYVTNPPITFDFPIDRAQSGEGARVRKAPHDAVFVTYVSFAERALDDVRGGIDYESPLDIEGAVLYWAWTRASNGDPRLPFEYETRYERKVL